MASVDRAEEVGPDHLVVVFERNLVEPADRRDARVVEPEVELAELANRLASQFFDGGPVADIRGHRQCLPAGRLAFAGQLGQFVSSPGRQDEKGASPGELHGRPLAKTTGGACDDDDLTAITILA